MIGFRPPERIVEAGIPRTVPVDRIALSHEQTSLIPVANTCTYIHKDTNRVCGNIADKGTVICSDCIQKIQRRRIAESHGFALTYPSSFTSHILDFTTNDHIWWTVHHCNVVDHTEVSRVLWQTTTLTNHPSHGEPSGLHHWDSQECVLLHGFQEGKRMYWLESSSDEDGKTVTLHQLHAKTTWNYRRPNDEPYGKTEIWLDTLSMFCTMIL